MSDPRMIREIINAVSIPVMAKVRIGHMVEAQVKSNNVSTEGSILSRVLPIGHPAVDDGTVDHDRGLRIYRLMRHDD